MQFSPLVSQLIDALRFLPGVGPKTAERMAFYILHSGRKEGSRLSLVLQQSIQNIGYCEHCRIFSETPLCSICSDCKRDPNLLCIVETPADVLALERTGVYHGYYFVLMGHLSPIDGIGHEELGLPLLQKRLSASSFCELILATNHTVEGEATAHYITELARPFTAKISRIAQGVPLGSELEYIDSHTLAQAFSERGVV